MEARREDSLYRRVRKQSFIELTSRLKLLDERRKQIVGRIIDPPKLAAKPCCEALCETRKTRGQRGCLERVIEGFQRYSVACGNGKIGRVVKRQPVLPRESKN